MCSLGPTYSKAVMKPDTDLGVLETLIQQYPAGLISQNIEGLTPLHLAVTGSKANSFAVTFIMSNLQYGFQSCRLTDKYG